MRCYAHAKAFWLRLEQKAHANDRWLYSIALEEGKGYSRTVAAVKSHQTRRRMAGTYRACRCGRDVPDPKKGLPGRPAPEAFICMGCEGYVSVVDPTVQASRYTGLGVSNVANGYEEDLLPANIVRNLRGREKFRLQRLRF